MKAAPNDLTPPSRWRDDSGFTLPELLVAMAVTAIILPALVAALIVALRTTDRASDDFTESYGSELLVSYFVPEVQSASAIGAADSDTGDTPCDSLESASDLLRLLGPGFASGYRRVDPTPSDGIAEYELVRWSAPLIDNDGNPATPPECGAPARTHVVAERITSVFAFSDAERQVGLEITTTSGHHYSVTSSQRTGTIDLNHRPTITSLVVNCHNLQCRGEADWDDTDGAVVSSAWDWGDGSPISSSDQHEYAPPGGTFTVTLTILDDAGAEDRATATVTVQPNVPPVAVADSYEANEDTVLEVGAPGVLGNDSDADPIVAQLDAGPANGSLVLAPDGSFEYTPNPDFFGSDSFTYHATDIDSSSSAPVTVTLNVVPVNDPPTASGEQYSTLEDIALDVPAPGVLGNDADAESEPITAVLGDPPANGSVTLNSDGSFRYVPSANWKGTDSFTYRANDGEESSNAVSVTIVVTSVNDGPPTVGNESYTVDEDGVLEIGAPGLLQNDSDIDGDPLTVVAWSNPPGGSLSNTTGDGSVTYVPDGNWNGTDSFTYDVSDGQGGLTTGTVTIVVRPINDRPSAGTNWYSLYEDTELERPAPGVLDDDADIDGDALTAVLEAGPTQGTLELDTDGGFHYVPFDDFFGTDTFTYRASDGSLTSSPVAVTIEVLAGTVNDVPEAVDDTFHTPEDTPLSENVIENDTDVDNEPLSVTSWGNPTNGTLSGLNANGSFTYTPNANWNGTDTFTYQMTDGNGGNDSATVTITVEPVNDPPPSGVPDSYTVAEDEVLTVSAPGVLSNDPPDPDGGTRTAVDASNPPNGSVSLNTGGSFVYTPDSDFHGTDTFTYQIRAGLQDSANVTVTITVTPSNDPPSAEDDSSYRTNRNTQLTVPAPGVLGNDSDVDGDAISAVIRTYPNIAHGTLTFNANGSFSFTPLPTFTGYASFTYWANDGTVNSTDYAIVTIRVKTPPSATFVLTCGDPIVTDGGNGRDCHADLSGWTGDDDITEWEWNWGEGPVGSGVSDDHEYGSNGVKTVSLTVTDAAGDSSMVQKQMYVNDDGLRASDYETTSTPRRRVDLDWRRQDFGSTVTVYQCAGEVAACDDNGVDRSNSFGGGGVTNLDWTFSPSLPSTITYRVCTDGSVTNCSNDVVVTFELYELRVDSFRIQGDDDREVSLHWSDPDFRDPDTGFNDSSERLRLYRCNGPATNCSSSGTDFDDDGTQTNEWATGSDVVTYRLCEQSGAPGSRCSPDLVVVYP